MKSCQTSSPSSSHSLVEGVALIARGAGNPDHVHTGAPRRLEQRPAALGRGRGQRQVGRGPHRAARKHRHAVDLQPEPILLEVTDRGHRAEADPSGRQRAALPV